ncbi:MAG: type II restriction endonuclease [Planctomycetota bacterium]
MKQLSGVLISLVFLSATGFAQQAVSGDRDAEIARGSSTARRGFRNEDEIREKFNNWRVDAEAQAWLVIMNYSLEDVVAVKAEKPHGKKADVEVRVTTNEGEKTEGISIKLVSNPDGFNQIDKRWLAAYAKMWSMPEAVHESLKLFCGETPPIKASRDDRRMFLDELHASRQGKIVSFFAANRERIVSDLFIGDGDHAANWMLVTLKTSSDSASQDSRKSTTIRTGKDPDLQDSSANPGSWVLVPAKEAIRFFGEGPVEITRAGNLRIGRITMQRKGGDNGRPSASMLQFKINPIELFNVDEGLANP